MVSFRLVHAVATVHFRADHVVSGTVLNSMQCQLLVVSFGEGAFKYNKTEITNRKLFGCFDFRQANILLSEISSSSQLVY